MEETEKIDCGCIDATQEFCSKEIGAWSFHLKNARTDEAKKKNLKMIKGYRAIKDALEKMK